MKRGRRPAYGSAQKLRAACERWFDSITREKTVTEPVTDGEKDDKGHLIYHDEPVTNRLGEVVKVTEFIVPPLEGDLAAFLGISDDTWTNYCDNEKHPEFAEVTADVKARIRRWNEMEMLTRPGKDIAGVKFNLENNYGMSEKREVSVAGGALEEYLRSRDKP